MDLAALASASCPGSAATPEQGNLETTRSAVLCLINRERARAGVSPLSANADLQEAAQSHSHDMVANDYFDHVSPSGETVLQRIQASGYIYSQNIGYAVGENIAWGTLNLATPQEIVASWMASPDHKANILDSSYRETGIGVVGELPASMSEGQPGAMYTQDFGVLIGS